MIILSFYYLIRFFVISGERKAFFSQYIEKIGQDRNGSIYKCKLCVTTKLDRRWDNLQKHVEDIHLPNSYIYTCEVCGEAFSKEAYRNNHMKNQH